MPFKFELKERVTIAVSLEQGEVIGRSEYAATTLNSYLVRYCDVKGTAVEAWWTEDALVPSNT